MEPYHDASGAGRERIGVDLAIRSLVARSPYFEDFLTTTGSTRFDGLSGDGVGDGDATGLCASCGSWAGFLVGDSSSSYATVDANTLLPAPPITSTDSDESGDIIKYKLSMRAITSSSPETMARQASMLITSVSSLPARLASLRALLGDELSPRESTSKPTAYISSSSHCAS
jgi:hypothetical protein